MDEQFRERLVFVDGVRLVRRRVEPGGEAGSSSSSSACASEDTCEGEDVPTGHERRQRTAREVPCSFISFFYWVFVRVCVCEASSVSVELE